MVSNTLMRLLRPLVLALVVAVASSALAQSRPDIVWKVALPAQPTAYAVSPDGSHLACGFDSNAVSVHRTVDGGVTHTLTVPGASKIWALAFVGGGQFLAVSWQRTSSSGQNFVGYFRVSDGQVEQTFHQLIPSGNALALASSPDGRRLAWGSSPIRLGGDAGWDYRSIGVYDTMNEVMDRYFEVQHTTVSMAYSNSGQLLASGHYSAINILRLADRTVVPIPNAAGYDQTNTAVLFSPDDSLLATGAGNYANVTFGKPYVRLWGLQDGVVVRTLAGSTLAANSLAFMADGTVLMAGGGSFTTGRPDRTTPTGGVLFWRVSDGELLRVWEDLADVNHCVLDAKFSPDQSMISYVTRGEAPSLVLARNPYGPTAPTSIDLPNVNGRIGDNVTITANLWNSGRPVADRALTVSIDGVALGSATTDAAGHIALPYAIPEGTGAGTREIAAEFAGDATYSAARATAGLIVAQAACGLFLPDRTARIETECLLKAYLYRRHDHGRPAGRTITFAVDGAAVGSADTDAGGQAVLPYIIPEGSGPGARTLTSAWAGDQAYGSAGAASTLTVTPGTIYLWLLEPRSVARGGAVYLRAYARSLPYYNWKAGLAIGYAVDGTDVGMAKTNADGRADWYYVAPLNSTVGDHTFTCTFHGNALYGPTERSGTFTVTL
jgi:WD40 repeat protein